MVEIPSARSVQRVRASTGRPASSGVSVSTGRGLSSVGAGLSNAGANLQQAADYERQQNEKADRFETQRRFLEFSAGEQERMETERESVQPGAFGHSEQQRASYIENAKEFRKSIPDHLKDEYEAKLFSVEDSLVGSASKFEGQARRAHYGQSVDDGLTRIESDLFANPNNYDRNLAEGMEFIDNIPDDGISQLEKAELKRSWEEKAKLAVLNGVTPEKRLELLGGIDAPNTQLSGKIKESITKGVPPKIRSTITAAANKYGVSVEAMLVVASIETGGKFNPDAKNPNSSAGGLFQQIDSNAAQYGVANRFNAQESAEGAARFMLDNTTSLRRVLGRDPTIGELYLAHQQGGAGAVKLLSNPNARAADLVGAEAVRLNGGKPDMTAGEFASIWLKKAGDTHIPEGGMMNASYNPERADKRFQGMDYMSAEKIMQSAQTEIAQVASAAASEIKASANRAFDDYMAAGSRGDAAAVPELTGQQIQALSPSQKEAYQDAPVIWRAENGARSVELGASDALLNQLKPEGEGYAVEAKAYDAAQKIVRERQVQAGQGMTALERQSYIESISDPVVRSGLTSQQSSYVSGLKTNQVGLMAQAGLQVNELNQDSFVADLTERLGVVSQFAEANGVAPVMLSPAEKVVFTDQFEQMNLQDKMTLITQVADNPGLAKQFFSEISKSAPLLSHVGGMVVNGGDADAAFTAMKGYQATLDGVKFNDLSKADKSAVMPSSLADAVRGVPSVLADAERFAEEYARGRASGGMVSSDDYEEGLSLSLPPTYQYNRPGAFNFRTSNMLLPPGVDADNMTAFLDGLTDLELQHMNGGALPRDMEGVELSAEYVRQNADYMSVGPGQYIIEFDDGAALAADGSPFVLSYTPAHTQGPVVDVDVEFK